MDLVGDGGPVDARWSGRWRCGEVWTHARRRTERHWLRSRSGHHQDLQTGRPLAADAFRRPTRSATSSCQRTSSRQVHRLLVCPTSSMNGSVRPIPDKPETGRSCCGVWMRSRSRLEHESGSVSLMPVIRCNLPFVVTLQRQRRGTQRKIPAALSCVFETSSRVAITRHLKA